MLKEIWNLVSKGWNNLVNTEYGIISPSSEAMNQRYCEIDQEIDKKQVVQLPEYKAS